MSKPTNIVFFTWHDAGDWFSCYGYDSVNTPGVDRLAKEGVRFTANHSACAICSPSRAAIMTGRFCQNNGVMSLTNTVFSNRIHPEVPHLAKRLKEKGYHSALFGVQHECAHEHVHEVMGFDELYDTDPWPQAKVSVENLNAFFAKQKDSDDPFYAQIGSFEAHLGRFYGGAPITEDEPYPPCKDESLGVPIPGYMKSNEDGHETVATMLGLLNRGDLIMQAILNALDDNGLTENTLVVMCVDHGVGLPRAKASGYDASTRTAWLMRKPGLIPAGKTIDALSTHVDVLPTLWDLLGFDDIDELDGENFAPAIRDGAEPPKHEAVFSHMVENTRSIRTERYRLTRNFRPHGLCGKKSDAAVNRKKAKGPSIEDALHLELYDCVSDPDNLHNLSQDPEMVEIRNELDFKLWDFLETHDDFILHEPVRTRWQAETRRQYDDYLNT